MAEIKILSNYCKGCGFCVKSCSKKVLEIGSKINGLGYKYATAVNMENCIACKLCALICPDSAIEIFK
jgi:2-oxoglutarate ferredoxin oxidoreductase subunit delta